MELTVVNLEKKYKTKPVLKGISFTIEQGQLIGLVGPNGAGKSTLMRSILGLEEIEKGQVTLNGYHPTDSNYFKYISFLPSDNYLYMQLSGYDHLAFVATIYEIPTSEIDAVIELIGIRSYVNQPVKSYSYGMRQHLLIALSILTKPSIILMDEPFNGLDPTSTIELKQLIRTLHAQGISIVVSTHNLDILEDLTNKIWFIKDGHLITDKLDSDQSTAFEIKYLYDGDIEQLLQKSGLAYELKKDGILTDPATTVDVYLKWLLEQGVGIQSVTPVNRRLEEIYKEFYEV
ncbi:ABC transporter ATP-binding protein [Chryseomicrobium sp. FSL W7-1435]|uniref:ABC transporter ATP-binding protein n=1 Tax=Chryseomicrobium sp. FSL W7-1435 TaxID=2921704 RepID=UPI00315A7E8A